MPACQTQLIPKADAGFEAGRQVSPHAAVGPRSFKMVPVESQHRGIDLARASAEEFTAVRAAVADVAGGADFADALEESQAPAGRPGPGVGRCLAVSIRGSVGSSCENTNTCSKGVEMVGESASIETVAPFPPESVAEVASTTWFRDWWEARRPGWVDSSWWSMPLRAEVVPVLDLQPGADLIAALTGLRSQVCPAAHDGEGMPDLPVPGSTAGYPCGCQVVLAAAWQAVASWVSVQAATALVDAVGPRVVVLRDAGARPGIADPAREEVAAAMRTSPRSAATMIGWARGLLAFPEAAALAVEGSLPLRAVQRVCEEVGTLAPGDAAIVIGQWIGKVRARAASRRPMTGQAAVVAARRLIIAAPSHLAARRKARAERRVELWPGQDGTATLAAVLPEQLALRIHRRLTAMAHGLDDLARNRPLDAKRADLFADILLGHTASQCSGVEVNVTVPLASLLGLAQDSGDVVGLGPVPVEVARALAADAKWRAWVIDAAGSVTATSSTTYRPSAGLARLVRAREPACRMPGCSRSAEVCDLDHAVPWPKGPTNVSNLGPLCRRHHVMKTHYAWDLVPEREVWRTPAGAEVGYGVG